MGERKGRSIIKGDLRKQLDNLNPQLQARETRTYEFLISVTRSPFVSKCTGKGWNPKSQTRKTGTWLSCCRSLTPARRPTDFLSNTSSLTHCVAWMLTQHIPQALCCLLSPPPLLGLSPHLLQDFTHRLRFSVKPSLTTPFELEYLPPITKLPISALVFPRKPSPRIFIFSVFVSHSCRGRPKRTWVFV